MATIDDRLTFEEFRKRCEDKSTITTKGQLYVGTSDHDTVNGKQITRTVATPEPVEYALLVRDDTQAGGLNWKSVADVLSAAKNDGHQSTSVERADYTTTAGVASNVESQINGHDISVIFETDGTTVKEATEAANVSQFINGQNISSIFENDGTTVKNATNAVNATNAKKTSFSGDWRDSEQSKAEVAYLNGRLFEIEFFDDSFSTGVRPPYVHGFFVANQDTLKENTKYNCPLGEAWYYNPNTPNWVNAGEYIAVLTDHSDNPAALDYFTIEVFRINNASETKMSTFKFRNIR